MTKYHPPLSFEIRKQVLNDLVHAKKMVKKRAVMEVQKKEEANKLTKSREVKVLNKNKEALPTALRNFNKAFAEYYKGFML